MATGEQARGEQQADSRVGSGPDRRAESEILTLVAQLAALGRSVRRASGGEPQAASIILASLVAGGHCLQEGPANPSLVRILECLSRQLELPFQRRDLARTGPDPKPGKAPQGIILGENIQEVPHQARAWWRKSGNLEEGDEPLLLLVASGWRPQQRQRRPQVGTFLASLARRTSGLRSSERSPGDPPYRERARGITARSLRSLQALAPQLLLTDTVRDYAVQAVLATRPEPYALPCINQWVERGAGPGSVRAWLQLARAQALLSERFSVTLPDLRATAAAALAHRIALAPAAAKRGIGPDSVVRMLMDALPEPQLDLR